MSIPKERLLSGTAAALAFSFLTACTSPHTGQGLSHANTNTEITESAPTIDSTKTEGGLSGAVRDAQKEADKTPITPDSDKTIFAPPFFPPVEPSFDDAIDGDTIPPQAVPDSIETRVPFSKALDDALKNAKKPQKSVGEGTPPFLPEHNNNDLEVP